MDSFLKNFAIGLLIIIILIIGFLGLVMMGSLFFKATTTTTTTTTGFSFTFSKISSTDTRVQHGEYFILTAEDFGNLTTLKSSLGNLINSTFQQIKFGVPTHQYFNQVKDFFMSRSNGYSVFYYYNKFIAFTINQ